MPGNTQRFTSVGIGLAGTVATVRIVFSEPALHRFHEAFGRDWAQFEFVSEALAGRHSLLDAASRLCVGKIVQLLVAENNYAAHNKMATGGTTRNLLDCRPCSLRPCKATPLEPRRLLGGDVWFSTQMPAIALRAFRRTRARRARSRGPMRAHPRCCLAPHRGGRTGAGADGRGRHHTRSG